jgi:hypothetical protein
MLDTFYNFEYSTNFFIFISYDREKHKEIIKIKKYGRGAFVKEVKSLHAAKCLITKLTKH